MVKLLICFVCAVVLAGVVLELRQQRMNLGFECSQLHRDIERSQVKLWNQQLQIGVYTAPNAIADTVRQHQLNLSVPPTPRPQNPEDDPDAEGATP